jgi:small subunit ribosomal protein S21
MQGRLDIDRAGPALLPSRRGGSDNPQTHTTMIEVKLDENDRLDWALKTFKKKVLKSGLLKDLRRKRHYVKPSEARQLKAAAARRRARTQRPSR